MKKVNGEELLYREWRYPSIPLTLLAFAFFGMLAIAYSAAFEPIIGIGILALGGLIAFLGIWNYSPKIEVRINNSGGLLIAGSASLPTQFIANPQIIEAQTILAMRRSASADTAYWMTRGNSGAVSFENTDSHDPHGLWVIASRNPTDFRNALVVANSQAT